MKGKTLQGGIKKGNYLHHKQCSSLFRMKETQIKTTKEDL